MNNIFRIGLSLSVIIVFIWIGGFFKILYPIYGYLVLLVALIPIFPIFKKMRFWNPLDYFNSLSLFEKILITISFFIFLFSFIRCLAPITGFDTLSTRVNTPKIYIQNHGFISAPYSINSDFPMCAEMIYLCGMLIAPYKIVNFIAISLCLLVLISIYKFCKRFYNKKIGLLAAFLVLTTFEFRDQMYQPLQDMLLAFFSIVVLWTLLEFKDSKNKNFLFLFGLFSGMVVGTKMNNIVYVFLLYTVLLYILIKEKKIKLIFVPVIVTLFSYSIWMIKAYLYTGNPFFPMFNEFFHSKYQWEGNLSELSNNSMGLIDTLKHILYTLYRFFSLSFFPKYKPFETGYLHYFQISPLFLFLIFVSIIIGFWRKIRFFSFFLFVCFIVFIIQYSIVRSYGVIPRHIFIVILLISIISANGFYLIKNKIIKRMFSLVVVSWGLFFCFFAVLPTNIKAFNYVFGFQTEREFHEDSKIGFRWYSDFQYLNTIMKDNEKVFLLDNRTFYLNKKYNVYYRLSKDTLSDNNKLYSYLKINNFKYIHTIDKKDFVPFSERDTIIYTTIDSLKKTKLMKIYENKKFNSVVYRIED